MLKKRTTKHNNLTYNMIEKEQQIRKDKKFNTNRVAVCIKKCT